MSTLESITGGGGTPQGSALEAITGGAPRSQAAPVKTALTPIANVNPVDTSGVFSQFMKSMPKAPLVSSTAASTAQTLPSQTQGQENPFNIPATPAQVASRGETLTADKRSPVSKAIDSIKGFFQGDSARDTTAIGVQNLIVNNNLADIGKQLGIDAQFPLDTTKDATTAKYYQDKQVSDYVRQNWNSIKQSLTDPKGLPDHPEELGPMYSDVSKNLDAYTKALGLRSDPTNMEIVATVMTLPIAAGLIEVPAATAIGLAGFTALGAVEHALLGDTVANKVSDALGLNEGTRDVLGLVELFAEGKMLHSVYTKAPDLAFKWTKEITEKYIPGKTITIDGAKVKDIFQTGKLSTDEEKQMYNDLYKDTGRTAAQLKSDIANGVQIQIPPEKVIALVDRPWWAKVKGAFSTANKVMGQPEILPTNQTISRETGGKPMVAPESRPHHLLGEGLESTRNDMAAKLEKQIKDSVDQNGRDATALALMKNLGFDTKTANDMITSVHAAKTPEEVKAASEALLGNLKDQGHIPDSDLPTIDAGRPAKAEGATIQIGVKKSNKMGSFTVVPIKESAKTANSSTEYKHIENGIDFIKKIRDNKANENELHTQLNRQRADALSEGRISERTNESFKRAEKLRPKVAPKSPADDRAGEQGAPKREASPDVLVEPKKEAPAEAPKVSPPIEGTGDRKVRGVSKSINEKAIAEKLTSGFSDLPEYDVSKNALQAKGVAEVMRDDYELAKRIAMGHEDPPAGSGLLPESFLVAVEDRAIREGDVATLRQLAVASRLVSAATTMGQRIQMYATRNPESPVVAMSDIAKTREKAAVSKVPKKNGKAATVKKATVTIADQIKKEIIAKAPKKQAWSSFIDEISC